MNTGSCNVPADIRASAGYPVEWFVDAQRLDDVVLCPICACVKRDAVQFATNIDANDADSYPCGHSFCRACIDAWLLKVHSCPVCRRPSERVHLVPDMAALTRVWTLSVRCRISVECQSHGTLGKRDQWWIEHELQCAFTRVVCVDCGDCVPRQHDCAEAPRPCTQCGDVVKRSALDTHARLACVLPCPNASAGCDALSRGGDALRSHLDAECAHALVVCPFAPNGCNAPASARCEMSQHLERDAGVHVILLARANAAIRAEMHAIIEQHAKLAASLVAYLPDVIRVRHHAHHLQLACDSTACVSCGTTSTAQPVYLCAPCTFVCCATCMPSHRAYETRQSASSTALCAVRASGSRDELSTSPPSLAVAPVAAVVDAPLGAVGHVFVAQPGERRGRVLYRQNDLVRHEHIVEIAKVLSGAKAYVRRGPQWKWDDQDGGEGGVGFLAPHAEQTKEAGWVTVIWKAVGRRGSYRAAKGNFDLVFAEDFCGD